MPTKHPSRWRCTDCHWVGVAKQFLRAPSPFDAHDDLTGCPKCKSAETMEMLCDEPDCSNLYSQGWQGDDGYRYTCHEHGDRRDDSF